MPGGEAWVTLATNDSYSLGAIVLSRSLRRTNTNRELVVMITPGVSSAMSEILKSEFTEVIPVNILDSEDAANLALLSRPELGITFTKLHCWRLIQYTKCVFLDADTLVLQSCDELFDREEFSAAPDSGWPDCFNSGVFVFRPSLETYTKLLEFAVSTGSFDGGDQGLLNLYFSDWSVADISKHLPFIYNVCASATYSYLPAYRVFGQNARIVHFIGQAKPWLQFYDTATGTVRAPEGQAHLQELLQAWWDIFKGDVHHKLTTEMDGESATMVEQVQSSMSHVFTSSHQGGYESYHSQQYHPHHQDSSQSHHQSQDDLPYDLTGFLAPDLSQLHIAIQRHPPENVQRVKLDQACPPSGVNCDEVVQKRDEPHEKSSAHTYDDHDSSENDPSTCEPMSVNSHSSPSADDVIPKGLAGAFAKISLEGEKSGDQILEEELMRKHAWEQGHIDYMGKDSFDNILKKIQASMAQAQEEKPRDESTSPPKPPTSTPQPEPESSQESLSIPEISRSAPEIPPAPVSPGPTVPKELEIPSPTPDSEISQLSIESLSVVIPVAIEALKQDDAPPTESPEAAPEKITEELAAPTAADSKQPETTAVEQPETTAIEQPEITTVEQPETTAVEQPILKEEAKQTEVKAPVKISSVPEKRSSPEQTVSVPVSGTEEELEEKRLTLERLAIEKKLADQKRIAEQKLEQEKKAAAATKAQSASVSSVPVAEEFSAEVEAPKAPPRKQSKGKK